MEDSPNIKLDPAATSGPEALPSEVPAQPQPENSARRPQAPLTEEQIRRMNEARYPRALSSEEIDHVNGARSSGIHHGL